ncbi:TIGR03086 family metal-binding protein [Glycomyces buryatensis]|uniref:TIGR03086 family protein n=1 Tax=Glycomyces buryatensis TaxID=2570927 RepID=A0A4S8PQU0_9ACTN|nr:TIGR03086 family metal-binding protein [Glycomyces buryatensis]THV33497.1 TIGR03086 family protein [Glycomyces buryatensis]
MNETAIEFRPATEQVAALLKGVDDQRLSDPTPCQEFTLGALLNHLLGLTQAFTSAARKERGPHTDTPPGLPTSDLDPQWRTTLSDRLDTLAAAWSDPEAWTGETTAGGVTLPAEIMGLVAYNEVAIHGWDLSRATGQHYALPPEAVELLLEFDGQDADDEAARAGIYGPVFEVDPDAAPLDRLIGITGRNPAWRPDRAA